MSITNLTGPYFFRQSASWGYPYKDVRNDYYNTGGPLSDFEALTEPLNIAASNGIDPVLESVRSDGIGGFSFGKGSCANSSGEYLDHQREYGTCFSTCHGRSTLFLPFNLEPCMKLATIAILIANGTFEVIQSDPDTNGTLKSLGIGDLTAWDGNKILENIVQCVVSSCDDTSIGTCPASVRGLSDIAVSAENLPDMSQRLGHLCDGFDAKLNPDIAGPGVLLSYLLQTSIALSLFLILKTLNSCSRIILWPLISLIGHMFMPRRPSAWVRASILQDRLAQTRLNAATITSLVEFQEVQAFFVISIGIATLATSRTEGRASSGSSSFAEALLNAQMVQSLAVNSILPVVLTQCVLQREGMMWWYSFGLTSTTVLLARIVQSPSMSRVSNFDTLWQNFKEASPVEACGGLPSPMTYCKTDIYNGSFGGWRGAAVACGLVHIAMATLLIDMPKTVQRIQRITEHHRGKLRQGSDKHELRRFMLLVLRKYIWPWLREFWWFGMQAGLLALVISYFTEVLIMAFSVDLMQFGDFNYGQLISVMVWAPTLGKFAYFSIFGIEEGFGRRLAKKYRVVRDVYEGRNHKEQCGPPQLSSEHDSNSSHKRDLSLSRVSFSTLWTEELKGPGCTVSNLAGPKACYRQTTSLPR